MKTLIIQTSPFRTASTFLVNALYGLIPELFDKPVMLLSKGDCGWCRGLNKQISFSDYSEDIIVVRIVTGDKDSELTHSLGEL